MGRERGLPKKAAPGTRAILRDFWPCAGGLSTVNAIGTQLRDLMKLGLIRRRLVLKMDAVAGSGSKDLEESVI